MMLDKANFSDLPEFGVAHVTNTSDLTGCSIFVARGECKCGVVCGVDVRGGAPATRETDLLRPENMVQKVNAVMIGGGSAFGLEAACGAMEALSDLKMGFELAGAYVPIVPAACLFDLAIGNPAWPDKDMGREAAKRAISFNAEKGDVVESGNVGAGCGATINKAAGPKNARRGGFGYAGLKLGELVVICCVAVNAAGDVVEDAHGSHAFELFAQALSGQSDETTQPEQSENTPCSNTTLGVVLTNAKLDKAKATKVSQMTHDGYARAIVPVHTTNDGDTIFTMASGKVDTQTDIVGTLACTAMEDAIRNACGL